MFYSWAYSQTKFMVCPVNVEGINKNNWFKSKSGIEQVMGELSRCGGQFKDFIRLWKDV